MKNIQKHLIFFSILYLLFTRDGHTTYFPGYFGSHRPPIVSTHDKDGKYRFHASFDIGKSALFNDNENSYIYRFRLSGVKSRKHIDTNYSITAFAGQYDVTDSGFFNDKYYYAGITPEMQSVLYFCSGKYDIGLGLCLGLAIEGGDYYRFRNSTDGIGDNENYIRPLCPLMSIFPMIRYNISSEEYVGFQLGLGTPGLISPCLIVNRYDYYIWGNFYSNKLNTTDKFYIGTFSCGMGVKI